MQLSQLDRSPVNHVRLGFGLLGVALVNGNYITSKHLIKKIYHRPFSGDLTHGAYHLPCFFDNEGGEVYDHLGYMPGDEKEWGKTILAHFPLDEGKVSD